MTREELRVARTTLGLTQHAMANRMRTGLRQYQKWENGEVAIRPSVALIVELLTTVAGTPEGEKFGV